MEKIIYILERVYKMTRIPVRYLSETGTMVLFSRGYDSKSDPFLCSPQLRRGVFGILAQRRYTLEFVDKYVYGACLDDMGNAIMIGPISMGEVNQANLVLYKNQYKIESGSFYIKRGRLEEICAALAIIVYEFTGEYVTERDIIMREKQYENLVEARGNFIMEYELDFVEQDEPRTGLAEEMEYTRHIKEGNPDAVKQAIESSLHNFSEHRVGKLADKSYKQNEYMTCVAIVLASRAAVEGGLDAQDSYLMSDLFFQKLEKCTQVNDMYRLIQEMTIIYAERVRDHAAKKTKQSYIEQAKIFISKHLNKPFTNDELAAEVAMNKSYLCKKFSEETGMTIQKYAQQMRIEAASNMLKYSDVSIRTIAAYLCFTSQSHLGRVFKEFMGETPQKYRNKFGSQYRAFNNKK